jgi:hypothetical protein
MERFVTPWLRLFHGIRRYRSFPLRCFRLTTKSDDEPGAHVDWSPIFYGLGSELGTELGVALGVLLGSVLGEVLGVELGAQVPKNRSVRVDG